MASGAMGARGSAEEDSEVRYLSARWALCCMYFDDVTTITVWPALAAKSSVSATLRMSAQRVVFPALHRRRIVWVPAVDAGNLGKQGQKLTIMINAAREGGQGSLREAHMPRRGKDQEKGKHWNWVVVRPQR